MSVLTISTSNDDKGRTEDTCASVDIWSPGVGDARYVAYRVGDGEVTGGIVPASECCGEVRFRGDPALQATNLPQHNTLKSLGGPSQ